MPMKKISQLVAKSLKVVHIKFSQLPVKHQLPKHHPAAIHLLHVHNHRPAHQIHTLHVTYLLIENRI